MSTPALKLYRVLSERVVGWCNEPAMVSVEVDVQHVVASTREHALRLSTLTATDVLEVGPLPSGPGVVAEPEEEAVEHRGHVWDRFGQPYARARCGCGWSGPHRTGLATRGRDALADLEGHYREVNRGAE